jgi:hypothetical protein
MEANLLIKHSVTATCHIFITSDHKEMLPAHKLLANFGLSSWLKHSICWPLHRVITQYHSFFTFNHWIHEKFIWLFTFNRPILMVFRTFQNLSVSAGSELIFVHEIRILSWCRYRSVSRADWITPFSFKFRLIFFSRLRLGCLSSRPCNKISQRLTICLAVATYPVHPIPNGRTQNRHFKSLNIITVINV